MTPQERQLLESLASRITNTPPPQKDAEADQLIQERIGSRPDALYILAQTVLIQEMALNQANARLHEMQQAQQSAPQHTSFLGRLFGGDPQYAQQPVYAQPQYGQPQYAPAYQPQAQYQQGAPSFLRSAATTATGVAAGALAFEGIESLIHGFGGGGGFGGGYGGGGNETIVNNYYEEPRGGGDSFLDNSADNSDADYSDDSGGSSYDDSSS
jgi:hypothetical protein